MSDNLTPLDSALPFRLQEAPFIGYKRLGVQLKDGLLVLEGSRAKYDDLDLVAKCLKKEDHPVPHIDCECGFYAYSERQSIYYSGPLFATVELFGTVIVHDKGYRASRQRVTHLELDRKCQMCEVFGDSRRMADGMYFGMSGGRPVLLCSEHGAAAEKMHAAMKMSLDDASLQLGVEVVWNRS